MKYKLLTIIAGLGTAFALSAGPITPEEALQRVDGMTSPAGMRAPAVSSLSLQRTVSTVSDEPAVYLFGNSDRMLVVAADDEVTPLLGYIDGPASGELPPQMVWWLQEYADQIEFMRKNPVTFQGMQLKVHDPAKTAPRKESRREIQPLLQTTWDQGMPYNNMCPEIGGQRAVTGCVATAAAQVMKYFNWPDKAEGSISYSDNGTTRSLDFSNVTFDWSNMLDSYSGEYNQTQADAVAALMMANGYAAQMQYSTDGSGAQSVTMFVSAQDYFKYNENAQCLHRDYYGADDWEQMIYDNLANVGPVFYAGYDGATMGHAFVCDGYRSDGYFHINWGWSGYFDGYFLLDALNPEGQGTGGNEGGYNYGQEAFLNFTTPSGTTIDIPRQAPISIQGDLNAEVLMPYISFTATGGGIFNISGRAGSFELAAKVSSQDGTNSVYGNAVATDLESFYGFSTFGLKLPLGLADGNYIATIAVRYKDSSEWVDANHNVANKGYVDLEVKDGQVRVVGQMFPFTYADLAVDSAVSISGNCHYSFVAQNPNSEEASETLSPLLGIINGSQFYVIAQGPQFDVVLDANQVKTIEQEVRFTPAQEAYADFTGVATFGLASPAGRLLALCNVTVEKGVVAVSSITLDKTSAEGVEGETVQLQATVLPEDATDKTLVWSSSDETVATVDQTGLVTLVKEGTAVITVSAAGNTEVSATCNVTVKKGVVAVSSITLDKTSAEGVEGETVQLQATVLPEDATDKALVWSSSDETVATVDQTGLVTLVKEGTAVITVSAAGNAEISATCNVTVLHDGSGVYGIIGAEEVFDIYDINGIRVKKDGNREDLKTLAPATYILRQGAKSIKVIVK